MLKEAARELKKTLGLDSYPVGVKFIWQDNEMPAEAIKLSGHRYCQALMKARRGEKVILDAQGIAVRAGHHCAQPLMRRLGIVGTLRASFSVYSSAADVERLARAVATLRDEL